MATCNRKCLSDPYSSCYIFGKFTTKNRQRKITDFVKRSYLTCFGYHNVFICVREKFTVPVKLWSIFFQLYWIRSVKYWFTTELYILEKNFISSAPPPPFLVILPTRRHFYTIIRQYFIPKTFRNHFWQNF